MEQWKDVENASLREGDYLERISVPGGWLYRCIYWNPDMEETVTVSMAFVPDPKVP